MSFKYYYRKRFTIPRTIVMPTYCKYPIRFCLYFFAADVETLKTIIPYSTQLFVIQKSVATKHIRSLSDRKNSIIDVKIGQL